MCLRATGFQVFKIYHGAELNKIIEATLSVNLYNGGRTEREIWTLYGHCKLIGRQM